MIFRLEDISIMAEATVAKWKQEAVTRTQRRQAAQQEGLDYPTPGDPLTQEWP
jgi:hypothetical protein